jgi:hypothetical protein
VYVLNERFDASQSLSRIALSQWNGKEFSEGVGKITKHQAQIHENRWLGRFGDKGFKFMVQSSKWQTMESNT